MPCPSTCPICAEIRSAALKVIGADGIDALTIERLSVVCGMPVETLISHYHNASACLHDTYEEIWLSIHDDLAAALASESGWRNALRSASSILLTRLANHPAEARLCFTEMLHGDHELLRRREASKGRLLRLLVRELGKRRDNAQLLQVQLELLIGAGFQTIAALVADDRIGELEAIMPELESRAVAFEPLAA